MERSPRLIDTGPNFDALQHADGGRETRLGMQENKLRRQTKQTMVASHHRMSGRDYAVACYLRLRWRARRQRSHSLFSSRAASEELGRDHHTGGSRFPSGGSIPGRGRSSRVLINPIARRLSGGASCAPQAGLRWSVEADQGRRGASRRPSTQSHRFEWKHGESRILAQDRRAGALFPRELPVHAEMVDSLKPDPALFLYACEKKGFPKEEALVVDDSAVGLEAAAKAGIRSLGFAGASHFLHGASRDDLRRSGAIAVCETVEELKDAITNVICEASSLVREPRRR